MRTKIILRILQKIKKKKQFLITTENWIKAIFSMYSLSIILCVAIFWIGGCIYKIFFLLKNYQGIEEKNLPFVIIFKGICDWLVCLLLKTTKSQTAIIICFKNDLLVNFFPFFLPSLQPWEYLITFIGEDYLRSKNICCISTFFQEIVSISIFYSGLKFPWQG